jgi:hypothetical protein
MKTLPLALLLGLGGCTVHFADGGSGAPSPGVTFTFANCTSDCGLDQNTVAAGGARTAILVNGIAFADVRSSTPSVATFSKDDDRIDVVSGSPGTTELALLDWDGRVFASAAVTVEATAQLTVNQGWSGDAPIIEAGSLQAFHVTTHGASGKVTKGDGSVRFGFSGTLSSAVAPVDGDAIGFTGTAGTGTIDASCPNAALMQPVTVVPDSAITTLVATGAVQTDGTAQVTIVPQAAAGPVYTGPCTWEVSDPSVTLKTEVRPELDLAPGTLAVFNLNRAGTFQITCKVAGQSATVGLTR